MPFLRQVPFRVISLIITAISIAGLVLVPKPFVSSFPPQPPRRVIPNTDVNPLGANFFLEREVELWKKEQTLSMAKEAGVGWAKQMFSWEEIEPKRGYFWDDKYKKSTWAKYDEIVALTEKYGIRIIASLDRPTSWTRKDNRYPTAPPDNLEDYGNFVFETVSHYRGRIQYYQIWNEPNIWPEWGDRPVDPAGYVELLKIAYKRAKAADPNVTILTAPLAQTLEKSPRNLNELDYLDAMYKAGAKDYFDVLSANAYGFDVPPQDPPDPNKLNFSRLLLLRQVMEQNGDMGKAIWLNEFGWNASPEDFPPAKLVWRRVSEEQQAQYTTEAINLAQSWGWVGVINLWYFRQVGDITTDRSDYFFRVVDTDFTPRLVFHKLKELHQYLRVAYPGPHEVTAPGVTLEGGWSLRRIPEAAGGMALASPEQPGSLTFTFYGTDVYANVLPHPSSVERGKLYVTVDGKSPPLPDKAGGRAYIDLSSLDPTPMRKALATGLNPGIHTLRLSLPDDNASSAKSGQGKSWVLDGFEVENRPRLGPFYTLLAVTLLGFISLGASFKQGAR